MFREWERERCWHTLIVNSLNLAWTKQSVCEYERGRKKFKKELIIWFTRMILLYYFNFCINILWLKKRCMSWLCLSFPFPTFLYYSCSPFAFAPHHSFYKLMKLQQTLQSSNAIFSWILFYLFFGINVMIVRANLSPRTSTNPSSSDLKDAHPHIDLVYLLIFKLLNCSTQGLNPGWKGKGNFFFFLFWRIYNFYFVYNILVKIYVNIRHDDKSR